MARRHSCVCIGRFAPQQLPPTTTLLWRRRSYASSLRARRHWHDTRREDYEQRSQSVRAVPGRSPRSRGVRAVGVVGGTQLDVLRTNLGVPSREPQGCAFPGASHSRVVDQSLCKAYRSESHGVQISGMSGRIDCLACEPSGIAVATVASRGGFNRPLGPPRSALALA